MSTDSVLVNRAAVLTLWAAIVAERLGYDRETALTLGRAVAGLNAQSKGRRLGIYAEPSLEVPARKGNEPAKPAPSAGGVPVSPVVKKQRVVKPAELLTATYLETQADVDACYEIVTLQALPPAGYEQLLAAHKSEASPSGYDDDALRLAVTGIGTGAIVATLVSRSLRAILFGVTATDWRVYAVVAVVVLAFAFLATFGPARSAARIDPMVALRNE